MIVPPPESLFTVAELKAVLSLQGPGKDDFLATICGWCVGDIETELDRRLVYRAPPESVNKNNIVASRTLANETIPGGSITQPDDDGRTLIYTVTNPSRSVSAGLITVTGTVDGVTAQVEVVDLAHGLNQHGIKPFEAIASIVTSVVVGIGTGDTLKIGSSAAYTEYHTPVHTHDRYPEPFGLWAIEWPIQHVISIHEDADRVYGTGTELIAGVDYRIADRQRIVRLDSGGGYSLWGDASRAVRFIGSSGYFGSRNVPQRLKRLALRLGALYYQEADKGQIEMASGSNALGSWSRFGPAGLTLPMKRDLDSYRRFSFGGMTGERDFDQEAA